MNIEEKIIKAVENNKLKLKNGERNWYQFYISVTKLFWARNNHDGFVIDIYSDGDKTSHLATIFI